VKLGAQVQAGDPLFELDGRPLRAKLAFKQAAVKAAESHWRTPISTNAISAQLTSKQVNTVNDREEKRFAVEKAQAAPRPGAGRCEDDGDEYRAFDGEGAGDRADPAIEGPPREFRAGCEHGLATQAAVLLGARRPAQCSRRNFDENDAWRVRKGRRRGGFVRGDARMSIPLTFVRFEPYVVPKSVADGREHGAGDTRVIAGDLLV